MRSGVRTSGPDASLTAARLFSVDNALQHNYSASRLEQEENNKHEGRRTQNSKCSHESGRQERIPRSLRPDFSLWTTLSKTIIIVHQDFSRKITVGIRVVIRVEIRVEIRGWGRLGVRVDMEDTGLRTLSAVRSQDLHIYLGDTKTGRNMVWLGVNRENEMCQCCWFILKFFVQYKKNK